MSVSQLFSYFKTLVSRVQHYGPLAGIHGAHCRALRLGMEVESLPSGAIRHVVTTVLQTVAKLVMTLLVNHFQQHLAIRTGYHFGCLKVGVVRANSMPIYNNAQFILTCNDKRKIKDRCAS